MTLAPLVVVSLRRYAMHSREAKRSEELYKLRLGGLLSEVADKKFWAHVGDFFGGHFDGLIVGQDCWG